MATKRIVLALAVVVGLGVATHGITGFAAAIRSIQMMDQCDPATFNAAFGPGTCVGNASGVHLDVFLSELLHTQQAGAWHFAPGGVRLRSGEEFQAVNHGGEAHTFTEVDEFGGGFIPELNDLSGNPVAAPECLAMVPTLPQGLIAPGQSSDPEDESVGVHHYQCCIHPWMRTDIIVR